MWIWSALLGVGLAAEPPEPTASQPEAPVEDVAVDVRVQAADDLAEAGDHRAARALLDLVLSQTDDPALRTELEARLDALPVDPEVWAPTARLAIWQSVMGVSLAPAVASTRFRNTPSGVVFASGLAGGVAGGVAGALYGAGTDLSRGDATAIILAEQLGIAHGLTLGIIVDEQAGFNPGRPRERGAPIGAIAGGVAGTALGYGLVSQLDLDDDKMAGAYHGTLWGVGLTLVGFGITYQYSAIEGGEAGVRAGLPVLIGADVGMAGGYLLVDRLGLDRSAVYAADLGALAAMGATLGFIGATGGSVPWTPHGIAWSLGGAGIAGGAAGIVLTGVLRAPRQGSTLPQISALPMLGPDRRGVLLTVRPQSSVRRKLQ